MNVNVTQFLDISVRERFSRAEKRLKKTLQKEPWEKVEEQCHVKNNDGIQTWNLTEKMLVL